jgi:UDP-glucose:(heptosyl)LPS alpha-1,3-glucosyltransferase
MKIAFCYESVLPRRGGCEMYIADLARRLAGEGHEVHLFACRWDDRALPRQMVFHQLAVPPGPRCARPWLFGTVCAAALREHPNLVSIGFDKTWGQDILYPLGGLHVASAEHNLRKYRSPVLGSLAKIAKLLDPAAWAFRRLEQRQYLGPDRPLIVVNSHMVRRHFEHYYGVPAEAVRVVHSAIDLGRFVETDRPLRRLAVRQKWGIGPGETVGTFVAMNYRLKGLAPLLRSLRHLRGEPFRLLVAGSPKTRPYQRLARRLGVADRVVFAGFCPDTRDCYFAADFLVHPTFYDPCSLVVLEALACGLPVITSRYNGASELFGPAEGFVIDDPHDDVRLAACLRRMLDAGARRGMAEASRRTAAGWTFDRHYREMLAVFEEAETRKRLAA